MRRASRQNCGTSSPATSGGSKRARRCLCRTLAQGQSSWSRSRSTEVRSRNGCGAHSPHSSTTTKGVENAALLGSSKAEGPYIERVRFPPNFVIQAHTHPDQRSYTILSGTWYIGYGEKFDETKLQALPPGSFYVEPDGVHHFVATKDEPVVL